MNHINHRKDCLFHAPKGPYIFSVYVWPLMIFRDNTFLVIDDSFIVLMDRIFYAKRSYIFSDGTVYFQHLRTVYFSRPYIFSRQDHISSAWTVYFTGDPVERYVFYSDGPSRTVYFAKTVQFQENRDNCSTATAVELPQLFYCRSSRIRVTVLLLIGSRSEIGSRNEIGSRKINDRIFRLSWFMGISRPCINRCSY